MFEKFPSLTRFSHGWTITEKLDGSNAAIIIEDNSNWADTFVPNSIITEVRNITLFAQSRKQLITPGKTTDNFGFAQWVKDNATQLVEILGEGRHFGEWLGKGIQRGYGLEQKTFALFNTTRWRDMNELDGRLRCVPVLAEGYMGEPGGEFELVMHRLSSEGSVFAPGFFNPEGIVMRHGPSGTLFKKTFDYDEQGKWAEKEARK